MAETETLGHAQRQEQLQRLTEQAEARFRQLLAFPASAWADRHWLYQGNVRIDFARSGTAGELQTVNKIFLIAMLWQARRRRRALSAARVKHLARAALLLVKVDVSGLQGVNQEAYDRAVNHIQQTYAHGTGLCNDLNRLISFLATEQLLVQPIEIRRVRFRPTDAYGRIASAKKLPLPPLVRAIIELKWTLDGVADHSVRTQLDRLAVLTQVFQYGLGLRIGEVLRLPRHCLVESEGQLFCRVWTEKGSAPMARYIPSVWRPAIQDAVERINAICDPWRGCAQAIENGTLIAELEARYQCRISAVDTELTAALDRLQAISRHNASLAQTRLSLLQPLADEALIELHRLEAYLPFASRARDAHSLVKFYRGAGFQVQSKPLGRVKHGHYLSGTDIKRRLAELIALRRNHFTYDEVFEIIQGRPPSSRQIKSSVYQGFAATRFSAVEWFAFFGTRIHSGRTGLCADYDAAAAAITQVIGGGYDHRRYLPLLDAEQLYPELFNQKTMTLINNGSQGGFFSCLKLSEKPATFFRKSESLRGLRYSSGTGYLLEQRSIGHALVHAFVAVNTRLHDELIAGRAPAVLNEGLALSSSSFNIRQKVSEHLFVVPSSLGGTYQPYLPCLLSYGAVLYALKPGTKGRGLQSAFSRHGVVVEQEVLDSFQTHQGRHWQTTSLFRAGLAASIVNKWMGRTDCQGDHYDHQTARERAQKVGALMLKEHARFLGTLPEQVRHWQQRELAPQELEAQLNLSLQTAHYSPLGLCVRDINLKPCEYHLKCLTGNAGLGCREFVFDLQDPNQRQKLENERDKAEQELARLFELLNRADVATESVEMHIEHQMTLFRNASAVLERSQLILTSAQAQQVQEFQPFRAQGSKPDDCAFQCGEES